VERVSRYGVFIGNTSLAGVPTEGVEASSIFLFTADADFASRGMVDRREGGNVSTKSSPEWPNLFSEASGEMERGGVEAPEARRRGKRNLSRTETLGRRFRASSDDSKNIAPNPNNHGLENDVEYSIVPQHL
jgi:hypothetical protein